MKRLECQIAVVGAGPAGLAAATTAAEQAADVLLLDDNVLAGGQIWRGGAAHAPSGARQWFERTERAGRAGRLRHLQGARVLGPCGPDTLLVETFNDAYEMHYEQLILATGARERMLPFPGWTLPGVMGAGGLQALVKGGLPIAGARVVVAGSGPLLLAVAAYLRQHGARIVVVAEQTPLVKLAAFGARMLGSPAKAAQAAELAWALRGVRVRSGCWITAAQGSDAVESVTLRQGQREWQEVCDYVACGFGLLPNNELAAALGCALERGAVQVDVAMRSSVPNVYAVGELNGIGGVDLALLEGQIAGLVAAGAADQAQQLQAQHRRERALRAMLADVFALRPEVRALAAPDTIVCRCEDVPLSALAQHDGWRSAKLQTRCGMGACQGRICGGATEALFGWTVDSVRLPLSAARLGSLMGQPAPADASQETNDRTIVDVR
jgi:NADPH-dependent 2,4-dienoyl-CoA reductase/sulfur reductase-like enzyme